MEEIQQPGQQGDCGLEMFDCEAHRARITKRACILRQKRARDHADGKRPKAQHLPLSFEKCLDCRRGKEISMDEKNREGVRREGAREDGSPKKTKVCSKCKEAKPLTDFSKDKSTKDGLSYMCRTCKSQAMAEYWRKKHPKQEKAKRVRSEELGVRREAGEPETSALPALSRQVGGDHYKNFAIQPVEFTTKNGLGFLEGSVVKRICRYNRPGGGGRKDLEKIIHEVQLLLELAV